MASVTRKLTTSEIARACGVSGTAVKKWIKQGKLPAYRTPGGHFRVKEADFDRFTASYGFPVDSERGPVVLIIDDDPGTTVLLARLLSEAAPDARVEVADDGYDGLVQIGALRPDVVLLDITMPRLDGLEVCRRVRSNPEMETTRVIVMSGRTDPPVVRDALAAGADAFVPKTDDLGEICAEALRLLEVAR